MSQETEDGKNRIEQVLAIAFRGLHHVPKITHPAYNCWEVNVSSGCLATYDFDILTALVFAAHEYAVRVEIACGGPGKVKLRLHPRNRDGKRMWDRHPTIQQALTEYFHDNPPASDEQRARIMMLPALREKR